MAIITKDGIDSKICSNYRGWRLLEDFSKDPTYENTQCGRYCRCKNTNNRGK